MFSAAAAVDPQDYSERPRLIYNSNDTARGYVDYERNYKIRCFDLMMYVTVANSVSRIYLSIYCRKTCKKTIQCPLGAV